MDDRPRRTMRRLTVELPAELVEGVTDAAGLARRSVDEFVADALARETARWHDAFPPPATPADVQRALDGEPHAAAFFATVSRRNRHAVLAHIEAAKRPATRARRIEAAIAMLRQGRTPYRQ